MEKFSAVLAGFGAIGKTLHGSSIVLELKSGKVYHYDPDHEEMARAIDLVRTFDLISISFEKFLECLFDGEGWEGETSEEVEKLREIRTRRARETLQWLQEKGEIL